MMKLSALLLAWCSVTAAVDRPRVDVVVGPSAPKLERFAADELAKLLTQLFDADVKIATEAPAVAKSLILVGSPTTNPAVQKQLGDKWPTLTDQGHLLRTVGPGTVVIGGGSPVATLWAVYELGHHFGVRSFLHGDVSPMEPRPLDFSGIDRVHEPAHRVRSWQIMDASPMGQAAWSLEEQKKSIDQLARLKVNRLVITVRAWQPFVHLESRGVKKTTATLWQEPPLRVSGDTPGRQAFRGAEFFENQDFARKDSYDARVKAGIALARGLIEAAHERGMTVTLTFCPVEFTKEFAGLIGSDRSSDGWSFYPAAKDDATRTVARELAVAQLRAYVETYPKVDAIRLDSVPPGVEVPGVLDALKNEISRLKSTITITGAEVAALPLGLNLPLPQMRANDHAERFKLREPRQGWLTHGWVIGDGNPTLYHLTRAAFEPGLTAAAAYDRLITPICGDGVVERIGKGFAMIEEAGTILGEQDASFARPDPHCVARHHGAKELPGWLAKVQKLHTSAMEEMYRGNTRARGGARPILIYHAKRQEFAFGYLKCLESIHLAGMAKAKGDSDEQLEHLEKAIDSVYAALTAFGDVARDPSDRGAIAVVTTHVYRPLQALYAEAKKQAK